MIEIVQKSLILIVVLIENTYCKNGNFIISISLFFALRDSFCSARAVEFPAKKFIEEEEGSVKDVFSSW